MTCTRITSVEYYESMARQIRREAGLSAPDSPLDEMAAAYARKAAAEIASEGSAAFEAAYAQAFDRALATLRRGHSEGRDQVAYYTDNGAGEANGVWWTPRSGVGSGLSRSRDPFRSCPDGAEVDGRVLRDLAAGRDPQSLEPLVRASTNGRRSVGYDLQFAAPKSVSVLAAFAGPEERARILAAHDRAVRRALDYAHAAGLIVTRTGAQGRERAPAGGVSAAVYRHFTSRAQDPHVHTHAILVNLSVRADGSTGGLDNREILLNAGGIAALYRSELADGLRAELGCEAVRSGRNFEVAGLAEPVLELFSKRRAAIERAAREQGFDTGDDRVAAQAAAFETRAGKDRETPLASLEAEWDRQLVQSGWTRAALFEGVRTTAEGIRDTRVGVPAERLQRLAEAGLAATLEMQAVLEERELLRLTAEALQCEAGADAVLEQVERLRQDGRVVEVGRSAQDKPVYATPTMVATEQTMLRVAYTRQDERAFVPAEVVTRVLADRPSLRPEQRAAVRHALNRDGGERGRGQRRLGQVVRDEERRRGGAGQRWRGLGDRTELEGGRCDPDRHGHPRVDGTGGNRVPQPDRQGRDRAGSADGGDRRRGRDDRHAGSRRAARGDGRGRSQAGLERRHAPARPGGGGRADAAAGPGAGCEPDGRDPAAARAQRGGGGLDAGGEHRLRRGPDRERVGSLRPRRRDHLGGGPRRHDPGNRRRLRGQLPRSRRGGADAGGADRLEQGRARAQRAGPRPAQA